MWLTGFTKSSFAFAFGALFARSNEQRPILRKRFLANFTYFVLLLYCFAKSFSIQPKELNAHAFVVIMGRLGNFIDGSFTFSFLTATFGLLVMCVAFAIYKQEGKTIGDLPRVVYAIVAVSFIPFAYASVYDLFYHIVGNSCVPIVNSICLNFGNINKIITRLSK